MEKTNHVLLVGEGADAFAREQNFPFVDTLDLISPHAREVLAEMKTYGTTVQAQFTSIADAAKDQASMMVRRIVVMFLIWIHLSASIFFFLRQAQFS